jgi:hypothetical protein
VTPPLFEDRDKYFALSQEEKDKNKDPDNLNLGYVLVKGIREYLKVCIHKIEIILQSSLIITNRISASKTVTYSL